ncbi:MAG: flagellar basal-body rod protein FlgB [Desulfuromonadaceae bacterium GWC2_58_13]|nr:MAG: flagellar basal-body rod protein FlgB [Desulfuromonadaceae bacterium GWC2_58_13]
MSNLGIFDRTVSLLEKTLDLRQQKQDVLASNIANADTPGFAPARLEFEERLRQALKTPLASQAATHAEFFPIGNGGLEAVQGKVVRMPAQSAIGDRNGVDLEQEMTELAENQILYETATQLISKKLGLLKYVAQDGR